MIQGALVQVLVKYVTTAFALPLEVGKTLLQVQWVPQNGHAFNARVPVEGEELVDDDSVCQWLAPSFADVPTNLSPSRQLSESSVEHDAYFADPYDEDKPRPTRPLRPTDENGYIVRQSVTDEALKPQYVIPVGSAAGASGMMFRLKDFPAEGWLSLWKGRSFCRLLLPSSPHLLLPQGF